MGCVFFQYEYLTVFTLTLKSPDIINYQNNLFRISTEEATKRSLVRFMNRTRSMLCMKYQSMVTYRLRNRICIFNNIWHKNNSPKMCMWHLYRIHGSNIEYRYKWNTISVIIQQFKTNPNKCIGLIFATVGRKTETETQPWHSLTLHQFWQF